MKWMINIRLFLLQALALGMLTVFTVQLVDANFLQMELLEELVEMDTDVEDSSEEETETEDEEHKLLLIFENQGNGNTTDCCEFYYYFNLSYYYLNIDSPPPELA